MTSLPVPGWLALVLLSLAAFRVYRLVARDTITEPVREAVTYPDDATVELGEKPSEVTIHKGGVVVLGPDEQPKTWRVYLSTLIRCPWCAGFYVSVAWWAAWWAWPRPTLFLAAPWAISAVVAMLAKADA